MIKKKLSILICLTILLLPSITGCNNVKHFFESGGVVRLDYKECEKYSFERGIYRKFYYDEDNIVDYNTDSNYLDVTESNVEYIKSWITHFKTIISNEDNKEKVDFDVENQIKSGDKWYIKMSALSFPISTAPRPEQSTYAGIDLVYVSFDSNCVYKFRMEDEKLVSFSDDPGLRSYFEDEFNAMIRDAKKITDLSYYYTFKDGSYSGREYYLFADGISLTYDIDDANSALIGYIRSEDRSWNEDEYFRYYSDFFGNHGVSYFEYNGTNYMKIELHRTTFYFWMDNGDYIFSAWDILSGTGPTMKQLAAEKVSW